MELFIMYFNYTENGEYGETVRGEFESVMNRRPTEKDLLKGALNCPSAYFGDGKYIEATSHEAFFDENGSLQKREEELDTLKAYDCEYVLQDDEIYYLDNSGIYLIKFDDMGKKKELIPAKYNSEKFNYYVD